MKKKILSITLFIAMMLSVVSMSLVPAFAADPTFPYHIAEHWTDRGGIDDQDFTFAFVGDIQKITELDYASRQDSDASNDTNYVDTLFTWIADNAEEKKIEHVFTLGDLTEFSSENDPNLSYAAQAAGGSKDASGTKEWDMIKPSIQKLDGVVPYSVVRGNHDDYQIDDYFNYEAYTKNFDGFYSEESGVYKDSITNSYRLAEINGIKFIFITLDFNPTRPVIAWMDNLLTQYSDHKAIITMHSYTWRGKDANGNPLNGELLTRVQLQTVIVAGKYYGADPAYIWSNCLSKHDNVIMTVSGHVGANDPFFFKNTGTNGNEVLNVLVNPQSYEDSTNESTPGIEPTGMVFLMHFNDNGTTIRTEYYSTILDSYKIGAESVNGSNNNLWKYSDAKTWDLGTFTITDDMIAMPKDDEEEETTTTTTATAPAPTSSKKGCKGSVSLAGIAIIPAIVTLGAVKLRKKDNA
ncbi:MAG: metallophosphoesterase [Clostridia bacterium]|nr:metallophosphoesterase [Clostridia bacterium]